MIGTSWSAETLVQRVIGCGLWQREFGRDPGRTLKIDTRISTIVGVLPSTFQGLIAGRPDDFFIPIASEPRLRRQSWLDKRDFGWLTVVSRLKPDTSQEEAKVNLDVIFGRFLEEHASSLSDAEAQRIVEIRRLSWLETESEFLAFFLIWRDYVNFLCIERRNRLRSNDGRRAGGPLHRVLSGRASHCRIAAGQWSVDRRHSGYDRLSRPNDSNYELSPNQTRLRGPG